MDSGIVHSDKAAAKSVLLLLYRYQVLPLLHLCFFFIPLRLGLNTKDNLQFKY